MQKKPTRLLLILLLSIFLSKFTYSNDSFSITSTVDKQEMYIGDLLTYTLSITFTNGIRIIKPGAKSLDSGAFLMLSNSISLKRSKNNNLTDINRYYLSIYELGEFSLPPLEVTFIIDATNQTTLKTSPIKIKIISITNKLSSSNSIPTMIDDSEQLVPKGEIPTRYYVISLIIILILVSIVLFFTLRKVIKYIQKEKQQPFQRALNEMKSLSKKNYLENSEFKKFFYDFSLIVRAYIEQTTNIHCTTMTTRQIKHSFKSDRSIKNRSFYTDLLDFADKVKFAKYIPDLENSKKYKNIFISILNKDKNVFEKLQSLQKNNKQSKKQ